MIEEVDEIRIASKKSKSRDKYPSNGGRGMKGGSFGRMAANQQLESPIFYVKTIKIFNQFMKFSHEILVEHVKHCPNGHERAYHDKGGRHHYNTSTIQYKDKLYYFKRIYDKEKPQL